MSIVSSDESQHLASAGVAQNAPAPEYAVGIDILAAEDAAKLGRDGFVNGYIKTARPVVVRGGMNLLGRAAKWNLHYFKSVFGDLPIGVVEAENGQVARYAIDNKPRFMPFRELAGHMEHWSPATDRNYISATAVNLRTFPHITTHSLHDELQLDSLVIGKRAGPTTIRFGTGDTDSALHFDSFANLSGQISGRKRWTIYDPSQNDYLAYFDGTDYRSRINIDKPDYEQFPAFRDARPVAEFVLGAGDLLFLPPFWWHRVVALSPSASLRVELKAYFHEWFNNRTVRAAIPRVLRRHLGF